MNANARYRHLSKVICKYCGGDCLVQLKTTMQPICKQCRKEEKTAQNMPLSSIAHEWLRRKWS